MNLKNHALSLGFLRALTLGALFAGTLSVTPQPALAFRDGAFRIGAALYQQNALGKITKTVDAAPSTAGAFTYPIFIKYDYLVTTEWYVSPQLSYTPIGRNSAGDATTTTLLQLVLPVGFDLYRWTESVLDWQFGIGLTRYTIQGNGGVVTLLNGTTPTQFVQPSRSSSVTTGLILLGSSFEYGSSRFGFDFIFEGLLSEKRTPSLVFSYSYAL